MAKRFTDTAKWKKEFIKGLSPKMKLLWFYILDDCDHAGIWEVDIEVASLRIGELITYEEAFVALGEKIVPLGKKRWFIEDFIFFQYGELSPKNRMHQSVIAILNKYNIHINKPLGSPLEGAKDIYMDKDKDKVNKKESVEKVEFLPHIPEPKILSKPEVFEEIFTDDIFIDQLSITHKGKDIERAFQECWLHHSSGGSPPTEVGEWKQKLNTWLINTKNGINKKAESINARRAGFAKRHSSDSGQ